MGEGPGSNKESSLSLGAKLKNATKGLIESKKDNFNKISEAVAEALENKEEICDDFGAPPTAPMKDMKKIGRGKKLRSRTSVTSIKNKLFPRKKVSDTAEESMFHVPKASDMRKKSIASMISLGSRESYCGSLQVQVVTRDNPDLVLVFKDKDRLGMEDTCLEEDLEQEQGAHPFKTCFGILQHT